MDKDGKQWISPDDGSQYALIGTDKNDNIYIARLSSAKTTGSTGRQQHDGRAVGRYDPGGRH